MSDIAKKLDETVFPVATAGAMFLVNKNGYVTAGGYTSATSKTRPSDTTAYNAGDCIGSSTDAGGAVWEFSTVGQSGQDVLITGTQLEIDVSSIPSGMTSFTLHLYGVTPPSAYADNAAWDLPSGDRASYLGSINLGSPVDLGSTLYVESAAIIGKQVRLSGTSLFGYVVTTAGFTPTSAAVKKVTLHTIGL